MKRELPPTSGPVRDTVVYRITEPWLGVKKMAPLSVLALLSIQKNLIVVQGGPKKMYDFYKMSSSFVG